MPQTQFDTLGCNKTDELWGTALFTPANTFISATPSFRELAGYLTDSHSHEIQLLQLPFVKTWLNSSRSDAFYSGTSLCKHGRRIQYRISRLPDSHIVIYLREATDRWREAQTLAGREKVLRLAAEGKSLDEVLEGLVLVAEEVNPDCRASIMWADHIAGVMRTASAPHLPKIYLNAIEGLPFGEHVGSCGAAISSGEIVIADDVMEHPNWAPYRELTKAANIRACWSYPVMDNKGKVIATFALYGSKPKAPDAWEQAFMHTTAKLASIVIQQRHAEDKLRFMAKHDSLTQLANRNEFYSYVSQLLAESPIHPFSLLFLDLDHFKEVNDTLGHIIGDKLLIEVSKTIKECVDGLGYCARLGGDEFAAILPFCDGNDLAEAIAHLIIHKVTQPYTIDNNVIRIGISIGITIAPRDSKAINELMRNADIAMYSAKDRNRNSFRRFNHKMMRQVEEESRMRQQLREAIENKNDIHLVYQPQVDLSTGKMIGCEALCRWNCLNKEFIPPARFIDLAERKGLIRSLSHHIIELAVAQTHFWKTEFDFETNIAINIPASLFMDESFMGYVMQTLSDGELKPEQFSSEITESILAENAGAAILTINQLSELGFGISIDDFGTGYSSLNYLTQFKVDKLKLDRSFIVNMANQTNSARVVNSVIALGHSLGMKIIAEGAETETQVNMLNTYGCDVIQGYYFAKPMLGFDIPEWSRNFTLSTSNITPLTMN